MKNISEQFADVKDFIRDMQSVAGKELLDVRKLIDDEFENVSDRDGKGWLSNFQTNAIMTP